MLKRNQRFSCPVGIVPTGIRTVECCLMLVCWLLFRPLGGRACCPAVLALSSRSVSLTRDSGLSYSVLISPPVSPPTLLAVCCLSSNVVASLGIHPAAGDTAPCSVFSVRCLLLGIVASLGIPSRCSSVSLACWLSAGRYSVRAVRYVALTPRDSPLLSSLVSRYALCLSDWTPSVS